MKQLTCLLLALIFALSSAAIAEAEDSVPEFSFKGLKWGDSMEKVQGVEGTDTVFSGTVKGSTATYIVYEATAVGLDMFLGYYFCDKGLYEVRYVLAEEHSNDMKYIDDYATFKNALTKKYGETVLDFENWQDDSKKSYYADKKVDALSFGFLTYSTIWLLDDTCISMDMSADNYEISMSVSYQSLRIDPGEADFSDDI